MFILGIEVRSGDEYLCKTAVIYHFALNWTTTSGKAPPHVSTILHLCCVKILKSRVSWFGHKWRQSDVMFRRFRAKIRVNGNRRHGCSFKATINFLIWNDVELVGLQYCYLGFSKFWKFLKIFKIFNIFFSFSKFLPSNQNFQKNGEYVRGQLLMNMCTKFQVDIFKNGWDMT